MWKSLTPHAMMQPTLAELAEQYLQCCRVIRNYSYHTVQSYKSTFHVFTKEINVTHPQELNLKVLEAFFFNGRVNRN